MLCTVMIRHSSQMSKVNRYNGFPNEALVHLQYFVMQLLYMYTGTSLCIAHIESYPGQSQFMRTDEYT